MNIIVGVYNCPQFTLIHTDDQYSCFSIIVVLTRTLVDFRWLFDVFHDILSLLNVFYVDEFFISDLDQEMTIQQQHMYIVSIDF